MNALMDGIREGLGLSRGKAPSSTLSPGVLDWRLGDWLQNLDQDYYDNIFPYANAIAQRFSTVIPYAVDQTGRRMDPQPAAVSALYQPNNAYSAREFMKYIALSILTQSHLDILIWTRQGRTAKPGGKVTRDNIAGYTFLPQNSREYNSDRTDYIHRVSIPDADGFLRPHEFSRDETIALSYSQHPLDPTRGISPAQAVKQWASIDDMIADYENGFFKNGAVPAGVMNIVSESNEEFSRAVRSLKDSFRGASNVNGIAYSMVPVDPATHKPSQIGKLVWVPFQAPNSSLDLETLSKLTTSHLSRAMAVPDIIMGIDNGQTYANAQQAERSFIENTLQPLLLTVWDKWQFELDRITGGLGYAITFTLDLPAQTDVEKVQADTQATQVSSFLALVEAGASPKTAARALGLPDDYAALTVGKEDDTEDSGADPQPVPQLTSQKDEAAILHESYAKTMVGKEREAYESAYKLSVQMLEACSAYVQDQREFAKGGLTPGSIATEWVDGAFAAYQDRIIAYAKRTGKTIAESIQDLAKTDPDIASILDQYTPEQIRQLYNWTDIPGTYEEAYLEHLKLVAKDAVQNGINAVQDILEKADRLGWSAEETRKALLAFVSGSRAESLARNELIKAEKLGSLYSALNMSTEMGIRLEKYWKTTGPHPCPVCTEMNGKTIDLDDTFMDLGDSLEINGKSYVNDFESKITADGHPNCLCVTLYRVKGTKDGVIDDD